MSAAKKLEIDSGMKSGLDAFMVGKADAPTAETRAEPQTPKPKKKTSPLTRKQGFYLSEKVDERLDKEWRNQKRGERKSKGLIVENILREYWKLPPLEE